MGRHCALSAQDADDGVVLDAMSKGTRPHRVAQGSAPQFDEHAAKRAVRNPVSWERRILVLGAEAITRRKRYGALFHVLMSDSRVDVR